MPQLDPTIAIGLIKANVEDEALDFKRTLSIERKYDQAELIKDVLAMANTVRTAGNPCYIIIGAKNGIIYDIRDLKLDDASIQQIVNSRIAPVVKFSYYQLELESKTIGVIEIPKSVDKPHFVENDF
jgi:predicted HTH transcriptional regulator